MTLERASESAPLSGQAGQTQWRPVVRTLAGKNVACPECGHEVKDIDALADGNYCCRRCRSILAIDASGVGRTIISGPAREAEFFKQIEARKPKEVASTWSKALLGAITVLSFAIVFLIGRQIYRRVLLPENFSGRALLAAEAYARNERDRLAAFCLPNQQAALDEWLRHRPSRWNLSMQSGVELKSKVTQALAFSESQILVTVRIEMIRRDRPELAGEVGFLPIYLVRGLGERQWSVDCTATLAHVSPNL